MSVVVREPLHRTEILYHVVTQGALVATAAAVAYPVITSFHEDTARNGFRIPILVGHAGVSAYRLFDLVQRMRAKRPLPFDLQANYITPERILEDKRSLVSRVACLVPAYLLSITAVVLSHTVYSHPEDKFVTIRVVGESVLAALYLGHICDLPREVRMIRNVWNARTLPPVSIEPLQRIEVIGHVAMQAMLALTAAVSLYLMEETSHHFSAGKQEVLQFNLALSLAGHFGVSWYQGCNLFKRVRGIESSPEELRADYSPAQMEADKMALIKKIVCTAPTYLALMGLCLPYVFIKEPEWGGVRHDTYSLYSSFATLAFIFIARMYLGQLACLPKDMITMRNSRIVRPQVLAV